ARFGFSTRAEQLSTSFRSAKQTGNFDARETQRYSATDASTHRTIDRFASTNWRSFCETQTMKTKTSATTHSMNRSHCQLALLLIPLALACFALSPQARAVCQEGCLTNENTVLGDDALLNNTTGLLNTATGASALFNNTSGYGNTANGALALVNNTTGSNNTAIGWEALLNNTTGGYNTATGVGTLLRNTTGVNNTALGDVALEFNTTGINNTAVGAVALQYNTTGSYNIAVGAGAGVNLTTGGNNIYIGNAGSSS